jgi:hypothetical protein
MQIMKALSNYLAAMNGCIHTNVSKVIDALYVRNTFAVSWGMMFFRCVFNLFVSSLSNKSSPVFFAVQLKREYFLNIIFESIDTGHTKESKDVNEC